MKRMKGKEYGLNIIVANATNLNASYLQLFFRAILSKGPKSRVQ
jgi:hypothetical protein